MSDEHTHIWGEVERARFTGNPHRKCQVEGCTQITLDLSDDDAMRDYEFTIKVVGTGENEADAWEDAKQSAAQKVEENQFDSAEMIGER